MTVTIGRRELLAALGGAAAAWPLAARAQQTERVRRIGIIQPASSDDAEYQIRVGALLQELQQLGWIIGRNIRIETRWTKFDPEESRKYAAELVALAPDAIVATGISTVGPLLQLTRTVPIVFPAASDPVAAGLVENLARPGGNATGFLSFEYSLSGKWPELLRQVAPSVRRAAVLRDPANPSAIAQFGVIQAAASSVGLEVFPVNLRDTAGIERALATLAGSRDGGLIVTSPGRVNHIIKLAAQYKLPAVCPYREMITDGGLISYGPDLVDQYRRAAGYVDRILKGEKPADLPVQAPTKYDLVINLKTAKTRLPRCAPFPHVGCHVAPNRARRWRPAPLGGDGSVNVYVYIASSSRCSAAGLSPGRSLPARSSSQSGRSLAGARSGWRSTDRRLRTRPSNDESRQGFAPGRTAQAQNARSRRAGIVPVRRGRTPNSCIPPAVRCRRKR